MARRALAGVVIVLLLPLLAHAAADGRVPGVPVQIKRLLLVDDAPAVLLMDAAESRYLLVFVDVSMAQAIQTGILAPVLERPLTHDLIGIFLRRFGATLAKVTITGVKDNTYYALLTLVVNGKPEDIDARPSDAFALAVRSKAPIFAAPELLRPVQGLPSGGAAPPQDAPETPVPPRLRT
jgi:bifunctional DNase/RNase